MRRVAALVVTALLVGLLSFSQEKKEVGKEPAEFKIPPEEAQRPNPVKPTPTSIAVGKRIYGIDCAMCHGSDGSGKSDLAEQMGLKLRDYRDPAVLKDLTDGELFYILAKGKGKMPGDEGRMKPAQRWHVINFLRSLARRPPAPKPPPKKSA